MKTIISIVAAAGLFSLTACNRTEIQQRDMAIHTQQRMIDSMKIEIAKKQVIDSMNELNRMQYSLPATAAPGARAATVAAAAAPVVYYVNQGSSRSYAARTAPRRRVVRTQRAPRAAYRQTAYRQPAYQPAVYQQAPVQTRRRGWSAKAKGAVIGAGTGAVAGAVINRRNRVAGAVIGGVLGAGAGTGIGAILDRRNGR